MLCYSVGYTGQQGERIMVEATRRLHHVRASELTTTTAQTTGMARFAALSSSSVGAQALWMGRAHVPAGTDSGPHHHGHSETGIFVVSGRPVFAYLEDGREVRIQTAPGDFIYVPPFLPHAELNPWPDEEAVVVVARTTQEAIVENLEYL